MPTKVSRDARAVVTGAGSGIGRAFALELARRGGQVICADINRDRAQETADLIRHQGIGLAFPAVVDVSRTSDLQRLFAYTTEVFAEPVSLVINNAGVGIGGKPVGQIGVDDWQWALGINLWGMVHGSELAVPQLQSAGRPAGLINVASAAAFSAAPGMAAYNVGKAGVLALSETIAAEVRGSNVKVTVLCPTFVKTNVGTDGRITDEAGKIVDLAMRWIGYSPERVARMALDANDRGRLYVVPQPDAKAIWSLKRHFPRTYGAGAGIINRFMPQQEFVSTTEKAGA